MQEVAKLLINSIENSISLNLQPKGICSHLADLLYDGKIDFIKYNEFRVLLKQRNPISEYWWPVTDTQSRLNWLLTI